MIKRFMMYIMLSILLTPSASSQTLFPINLPDSQWMDFQAMGFSHPVSGVIYHPDRPPCCGLPLGGISTGCVDLDVAGVYGFSTIFSDYTLHGAVGSLWRGVPRTPPAYAPFLGLSVSGQTWVLCSSKMGAGGEIPCCQESILPRQDWMSKCAVLDGVKYADQIHYWGHYPIADMEYETSAPIGVGLRAWSSFYPGDAVASNIPGAVFEVHLRNLTNQSQAGTVAFTFPGCTELEDCNAVLFGHSRVDQAGFHGVSVRAISDMPVEYALGVIGTTEGLRLGGGLGRDGARWARIGNELPKVEGTQAFYTQDMRAQKDSQTNSAERGATAAVDFNLNPGEERIIRFVLTWFAPSWIGTDNLMYSHMYNTRYGHNEPDGTWRGSAAVASELAQRHEELLRRILSWQEVIYTATELPNWLRDALINSLALIPEDSFWFPSDNSFVRDIYGSGGSFFGMMESPRACPQIECIPCTWYGNQPIVYFFPELALSTLQAYKHFQKPDGEIPFTLNGRQVGRPYMSVPGYYWQMSLNSTCFVHLVDRSWLRSGDDGLLKEFYESVKKATIFTMNLRRTPDGVVSMPQANEGMEWFEAGEWAGMCAHLGGLRLAQLRIAERMAEKMKDTEFAAQCRQWFEQGSNAMETKMWTGSYYMNFWEEETGKKSDDVMAYQSDGEWAADFHHVPGVYRQDRVKEALATIRRCNVPHAICGAINFARPDGSLLDPSSPIAAYGTHDMFPPEVLILAMNYIYEGEKEFGLDLARRSIENIFCKQRHPWDQPNRVNGETGKRVFGTDYYQNLMLWSLPSALADKDISGPCKQGGLIDRILRASTPIEDENAGHKPVETNTTRGTDQYVPPIPVQDKNLKEPK